MDSTASVSGDLLLTTFSEVTIVPTKNDNGKQLSCLAENPALGATPTRVLVQLDVQSKWKFAQEHSFRNLFEYYNALESFEDFLKGKKY